jgi:hypothetical protein
VHLVEEVVATGLMTATMGALILLVSSFVCVARAASTSGWSDADDHPRPPMHIADASKGTAPARKASSGRHLGPGSDSIHSSSELASLDAGEPDYCTTPPQHGFNARGQPFPPAPPHTFPDAQDCEYSGQSRRIALVHVGKTAGSSVHGLLGERVGSHERSALHM